MSADSFHDTIGLSLTDLRIANAKAVNQEERILNLFQKSPRALLTPEDALSALTPGTPLTSARRAITNLTNRGLLLKTGRQRFGKFGALVHYWRLTERAA